LTEDPATGSDSAILAAYMHRRADDQPQRLHITQGVEMGRPSTIETDMVLTPDGQQKHAVIAGQCVAMMEGKLLI
ncbi:MAG: PhzF family phenazine biosynthesis protein, partial [Pseudomonadota bacterium]